MVTKEMIRPASTAADEAKVDYSTLKTVLVHIQDSASAAARLETALSVARAAAAHVTCLHVTPIEAYVAFDSFGGVFVMNDVMSAIDEEAARLRKAVEDKMSDEDVSWDYVQVTGNVAGEIASYGALTDLIVTSREPLKSELGRSSISLLGDLLAQSSTPLLIPGDRPIDPTGNAVIAWNGSFEAANAVRQSLGLLRLASSVRVINVTGALPRSDTFPGTRLLEYLSRQGIHAELVVESVHGPDDEVVAAGLVAHARSIGGYIVMGGYGHSRVREFLFGGVTRTMLSEATVPVVIGR